MEEKDENQPGGLGSTFECNLERGSTLHIAMMRKHEKLAAACAEAINLRQMGSPPKTKYWRQIRP